MSKPLTRVAVSIVICFAFLAAAYTVVQAGPIHRYLTAGRVDSHLVSGAKVNFNHQRLSVVDQALYQSQLDLYYGQNGNGHGCNSSSQNSPDD